MPGSRDFFSCIWLQWLSEKIVFWEKLCYFYEFCLRILYKIVMLEYRVVDTLVISFRPTCFRPGLHELTLQPVPKIYSSSLTQIWQFSQSQYNIPCTCIFSNEIWSFAFVSSVYSITISVFYHISKSVFARGRSTGKFLARGHNTKKTRVGQVTCT